MTPIGWLILTSTVPAARGRDPRPPRLRFRQKIGLIVAAAFWVAQRPGVVELDWLGYHVTAQIGIVLLGLFVALLFILALHRIVLGLAGLPKAWRERKAVKNLLEELSARYPRLRTSMLAALGNIVRQNPDLLALSVTLA